MPPLFVLRRRKSPRSKERMCINRNWSLPRDGRNKMKIGFIGLGIMGSRMAANLQKQGHSLVLFNRTRAKAEPLLGPCGTFSDSPAKVADQVDILFTMLAHPDAVEQAALRANGFLNYLRRNALWVDCSSVNPSFSKKMAAASAARQIHFVDAPVTGSAVVAEQG